MIYGVMVSNSSSNVVVNELRPIARSGKLGIKRLQFRDASDVIWTREEQALSAS